MKYLDSGLRDPSQALGRWLEDVLREEDIVAVRWQSGFFSADGLGYLASTLERLREDGSPISALVGSNNGDTLRSDVERLAHLLKVPSPSVALGVVSFAGAFFHPKTYHFTRRDGSQAAYVGSANLTSAGVGSLHVEAGVVLDTREGDASEALASIRAGVDGWFSDSERSGLTLIDSPEAIVQLAVDGVLAAQPTPRSQSESGYGNAGSSRRRPRLRALVRVPRWGTVERQTEVGGAVPDEDLDDIVDEVPADSSIITWDLVWRSKGLSKRDLNIPGGDTTNATGSIGLKKGDWNEEIDHRHYFRDDVFADLPWSQDARKPTREVATAVFEVWIDGQLAGEPALTISHNTDTSSTTYAQKNEMTHLRWGEAKQWVAKQALLDAVLTLYREQNPLGVPKFRISINRTLAAEELQTQ